MSENDAGSSGIGFLGLLGIAFIVLKLCHVIAWSWWWVTCPLWGGLAVVAAIMLLIGVVVFFSWLLDAMS